MRGLSRTQQRQGRRRNYPGARQCQTAPPLQKSKYNRDDGTYHDLSDGFVFRSLFLSMARVAPDYRQEDFLQHFRILLDAGNPLSLPLYIALQGLGPSQRSRNFRKLQPVSGRIRRQRSSTQESTAAAVSDCDSPHVARLCVAVVLKEITHFTQRHGSAEARLSCL